MVQLVEKFDTLTPNGVLSKGVYKIDKAMYFVKGNSGGASAKGFEPFSEVMASEIATLLKIPHIPYMLYPAIDFPEIHTYKCDYVSVCPLLRIPSGTVMLHLGNYLRANYASQRTWLANTRAILGTDLFYKMLLFDAFIGNEDRHLNNIDVLVNNGVVKPAPLFDNGGSLLAWHNSKEVATKQIYLKVNASKPFAHTHRQQVMIVDRPCFETFDLEEFYAEVLERIEPTLQLLSVARARAIRNYLKDRLKYLEWGFA